MNETSAAPPVLSHLRQWLNRARAVTACDAELLERYLHQRDETAFAVLIDRHGPMVLSAARRIVGDEHLAEDVFQATFLTLARRAGRLRRSAALPAWLHTTACNLSVSLLRSRKRCQRAEAESIAQPSLNPEEVAASQEQLAILDEELRRLPERFRLPLILCCLEGRSQAETARLLDWTPGSVKGRLERGRRCLRDRLIRRGVAFTVAAAAPPLATRPVLAALLRDAVLRAARPGAAITPLVSALVQEACRPLLFGSVKAVFWIVFIGFAATGIGVAARFATTALPADAPPAVADRRAEADPDALPSGAVARLVYSPLRIGNADFVLTPDGKSIVTVTPQGLVRRFDAANGRLLERRQLTDRRDVNPADGGFFSSASVGLSIDGQTVAIGETSYTGGRVTVYDVVSGKKRFRRASTEKTALYSGTLSPDGKQLAVIESENKGTRLRVFDLASGRMREMGPFSHGMLGIQFFGDGKRLVVIEQDITQTSNTHVFNEQSPHIITCFDLNSGKKVWRRTMWGHHFQISEDGKTVIACGRPEQREWSHRGYVTVQDIRATGFHILEVKADAEEPAERFVPYSYGTNDAFSFGIAGFMLLPDKHTFVLNYYDDRSTPYIVLWDFRTQKEIRRFKLPPSNRAPLFPISMVPSADGRTLLTKDDYLQRWNLTTGKPFFTPPPDNGLSGAFLNLAFTPDGKEVFASSLDGKSDRWNVATGKRLDRIGDHFGGQPFIRTPEGLRTVRQDAPKAPEWFDFTILDPVHNRTLCTIRWNKPPLGAEIHTLTANGKTLLALHRDQRSGYITSWDVETGCKKSQFAVSGPPSFPPSPFSPCGRWMMLNDKLYHVASGTELFAPAGKPGERLVPGSPYGRGPAWFSADGRLMAAHLRPEKASSAAEDVLAVWEPASGQIVTRIPHAGFVARAAFAPDGRLLALLDAQGVHVHEVLSGKRLAFYPTSDVSFHGEQSLVFAPDGATLATGHVDGSIVLWKVPQTGPARSAALSEEEGEKLWNDLADSSCSKARTAIERFASHPDKAVSMLATRLRPPPADAALAALIKDLDSEVFAVREEASRKLRDYGARAEPALRRTLRASPSLEMRRRIEAILADNKPPILRLPLSGAMLRRTRAIEVLERIGNAPARKLLQAWVEQTEQVQLSIEARLALERLGPDR